MPRLSRLRLVAMCTAALVVVPLVSTTADDAEGSVAPASTPTLRVGRVTLHKCGVTDGAYCGSIKRAWDPSGVEPGRITVGFAYVPAHNDTLPAVGTVVPHEGGPGYSTTGSGSFYARMYGPLLARRNLLLVDQRGTGLSEPIDCPDLQDLHGRYAPAAGRCGRSLGIRSDNYSSAESADDLAAVLHALEIGRIDLYGDSYGTFFAQVFAGRHPGLLRSVVLDSAYPTYGESAWYPTQTPAMQNAFTLACARSVACATAGRTPMQLLRAVLAVVRAHPYRGMSHDADGRPMHVVVDGKSLVSIAFGATYGAAFYREFAATLRSALLGDPVPLLRLTAEANGGSSNGGPVRGYSEGLDAAVACHDYPQLFDMTAPPSVRRSELAASVRRETRRNPGVFAPFTIAEYLGSYWEEQDWCTQWPVAAESNPAGPPRPPSGHYPPTPILVLSGELDSITTAAEGAMVVSQFPNARQVIVANSFHVTAGGDTDRCAVNVFRYFERRPAAPFTRQVLACTRAVPPIRTLGVFPQTLSQVPPATNLGGSHASLLARRAAAGSAATAADLLDRWLNNYSGHGVGLRGGTWSYTGNRATTFHLRNVRLTRNLAVSGTAVWGRYANTLRVDLAIRSSHVTGHVRGSWDTRTRKATATLTGTLNGIPVRLTMLAP